MSEKINVLELPIEKQFMKRLVKPDTWILNGFVEDCAAPHPHVVIGDKYAAVIDTTDLPYNVREYVEKCVTDKPLVVVCSHSHGDHTANNYQFEGCPIYMTEVCWEEIQESRKRPRPGMPNGWDTPLNYEPTIVKPGDVIDLGGRGLEVIEFNGCHSASSAAYLDTKYGCLFTGDEFEGGQVLVGGAASKKNSVEFYRDNLVKLRDVVAGRATCICPPHNGSPLDPLTLDNMIENCERIMSGIPGMEDVSSMSYGRNPQSYHNLPFTRDPDEVNDGMARLERGKGTALRSEWKGTSIVYNRNRVFLKDLDLDE